MFTVFHNFAIILVLVLSSVGFVNKHKRLGKHMRYSPCASILSEGLLLFTLLYYL